MQAITYTQARKNSPETMNQVCDNHASLIITRQNERPVVMMSLDDYNAIGETLYLIKTVKNAARLSKALVEIEQRKFLEKTLLEE
jgi:antitoxin YefM